MKPIIIGGRTDFEKSVALARNEFESSCYTTAEFASFARASRNEMKKHLTALGCKMTNFNRMHFEWAGFFRDKFDRCWYFSISNVRSFGGFNEGTKIMIRTAKDEKDYTGGSNQYVSVKFFSEELTKILERGW